jgi:replicative DNA helicase
VNDIKYFLGQLLLDNTILYKTKVNESDIEHKTDMTIFSTIKTIFKRGDVADITTVASECEDIDVYKLAKLTTSVLTSTWRQVEVRIKKQSARRKLLNLATVIKETPDNDEAIRIILNEVEGLNTNEEYKIQNMKDLVSGAIDKLEERYNSKGKLPGITTGLRNLDDYIMGFEPRKYYVFGARPSQGKTAILLNFVDNCRVDCGMLSAESASQELLNRLFSINGKADTQRIATGNMKHSDFSKIVDTASEYSKRNIYIYDEENMNLETAIIKAREMKRRFDIKILFVDYLQCLTGNQKLPRHEQVAEMSKSMKALARKLNIPVVVAAQLRRDAEGKRPTISDFSDSTQIERDADVAVMIYNNVEKTETGDVVKNYLLVEKNRDGRRGDIRVIFRPEVLRFENYIQG